MASQTTVHAHQSHHFEDLQLSAKQFYALLQTMVESYQYPAVTCTRVTRKEGGVFSASREYLRISKQRSHYYVCASPFGTSFFISWWLQEDANSTINFIRKLGWLGRVIAARMEAQTYYQRDTELMFIESIKSIIKLAVNKVEADRGYRKDTSITP